LWADCIELCQAPWWALSGLNRALEPDVRPLTGVRATVEEIVHTTAIRGKPSGREVWVTISGPGFEWPLRGPAATGDISRPARDFAATVNAAASSAAGQVTDADLTSRLADLHAAGMLTDEEFAAAKARVLNGE
jgi:hypothetical protein